MLFVLIMILENKSLKDEINFDPVIIPFDENKAKAELKEKSPEVLEIFVMQGYPLKRKCFHENGSKRK